MAIPPLPPLRIREADGSPNVIPVFDIVASNMTVTNLGGGVVKLDAGGSQGPTGPAGTLTIGSGITGGATDGYLLMVSGVAVLGQVSSAYFVNTSRSVSTIYPISGGGNLSLDRTFAIDTAFLVNTGRSVSTTYPIGGGGNLSADRTLFLQTGALGQILITSGGVTGDLAWVNSSGAGSSTVYAPTGGFYVTWSADTLLASEKILTASNNITITTSATAIFISAETGAGGSGDITSVGDVASGAAFALGSSQGTTLWFHTDGGSEQGAAYLMFLNSGGSLPTGTPARYEVRGDVYIGNASGGAHLFFAPDQGIIRGYGQTNENAGASFESFGGPESFIELRGAKGTYAVPTSSSNADWVGATYFSGYDGSGFVQIAGIVGLIDGGVSAGNIPGRLEFYTSSGGQTVVRLVIDSAGKFSFVSSGGFDTVLNVHRSTATRTIFTPDSSGTLAINARYPILLSSGGDVSLTPLGSGNIIVGSAITANPIILPVGSHGQMLTVDTSVAGALIWANTLGGASGAIYAATGNSYATLNFETDLTGEFRLVQSGNSVTISTAGNLIIINAITNAAAQGGAGVATVKIPMALMSVEVNSGNAYWTAATNGTVLDESYIVHIDSGRSISTWWCRVPYNVNSSPAWNLDVSSYPTASSAGIIVLSLSGTTVTHGESANGAVTGLVAGGSFGLQQIGILTVSTMSATNFDGTLATSAGDYMKVQLIRHGASDTYNADFRVISVDMRCLVDT